MVSNGVGGGGGVVVVVVGVMLMVMVFTIVENGSLVIKNNIGDNVDSFILIILS